MTALLAVLAAMLTLASSGCGNPSPPNVVLLVADTLGADHVGAWGSPDVRTPCLDRLARKGVCYSAVRSTSSWTLPSVASLLTGLYPSSHGATDFNVGLSSEVPYAPALFAEAGFTTAAVVSHHLVGTAYGFESAFDHFDDALAGSHRSITSARISKKASVWLWERHASKTRPPFFLLCHYFDPHWVYRAHDAYLPQPVPLDPGTGKPFPRAKYISEIAFTDRHIGRLVRSLEEVGELESTILLFTADHGESFGQHGLSGHTYNLHEELLHVPCLLVAPGGASGEVDPQARSLVGALPTLLELCGMGAPQSSMDGSSWFAASSSPEPVLADLSWRPYRSPGQQPGAASRPDHTMRALIVDDYKIIWDLEEDRWSLFDLAADPAESEDLAARHPELADRLRELLRSEWERIGTGGAAPRKTDLSDGVHESLRALGYVD